MDVDDARYALHVTGYFCPPALAAFECEISRGIPTFKRESRGDLDSTLRNIFPDSPDLFGRVWTIENAKTQRHTDIDARIDTAFT